MFISPARRRWVEHSPMYCLIGEHRSRNALQDYKGSTKLIKVKILVGYFKRFLGQNMLNSIYADV